MYKEKNTILRQKINELAKEYAPDLLDKNDYLPEVNAIALATRLIALCKRMVLIKEIGELIELAIKEGKRLDEFCYIAQERIFYAEV